MPIPFESFKPESANGDTNRCNLKKKTNKNSVTTWPLVSS